MYNIIAPQTFDFEKKYLLVEEDGIKFIKLRLQDSGEWSAILTQLLHTKIIIVRDYETENKEINILYQNFKKVYRIPENYLKALEVCDYLNYYLNKTEKEYYLYEWSTKKAAVFTGFTESEYKLYDDLCNENNHILTIQLNHYMDEGCTCALCCKKRISMSSRLLRGESVKDKVVHEHERVENKLNKIEKLKSLVKNQKNGKLGSLTSPMLTKVDNRR